MSKLIMQDNEAKIKLMQGVDKVANLVKITLGPKGNNVILDRHLTTPLITNDGVTIAKEIELKDSIENMGAKLIKQASIKTNEIAGDGTTTAIVLAQSLLNQSYKKLNDSSPILLSNSLKYIANLLAQKLAEETIKISTNEQIKNIATISSGDQKIGEMIAKAKQLVGTDGVITLIDSNSSSTDLSVEDGMRLDTGYISPYLCNNLNKQLIEFDSARVLIFDKKIDSMQSLIPILEQVVGNNQKLLLICDDIEDEVLKTIIVNKMRGAINIAIIKAPFYGEKRTTFLQDFATLCGTEYFSESRGDNLKNITIDMLGNASNIVITKDTTTLLCKANNKDKTTALINQLKEQIACAKDFEKEELKARLARLNGGIAVISVGADTEVEKEEKKLRIEDALSSTNSAIEQGINIGGGVALFNLIYYLDALNESYPEHSLAIQIMRNVVQAPLRQIAINCGKNDELIIDKMQTFKDKANYGYDALNDSFCDLIKQGIIDPTKVTVTALKNACSVATTILTMQGVVTEETD